VLKPSRFWIRRGTESFVSLCKWTDSSRDTTRKGQQQQMLLSRMHCSIWGADVLLHLYQHHPRQLAAQQPFVW
jgi:hypothetical protein